MVATKVLEIIFIFFELHNYIYIHIYRSEYIDLNFWLLQSPRGKLIQVTVVFDVNEMTTASSILHLWPPFQNALPVTPLLRLDTTPRTVVRQNFNISLVVLNFSLSWFLSSLLLFLIMLLLGFRFPCPLEYSFHKSLSDDWRYAVVLRKMSLLTLPLRYCIVWFFSVLYVFSLLPSYCLFFTSIIFLICQGQSSLRDVSFQRHYQTSFRSTFQSPIFTTSLETLHSSTCVSAVICFLLFTSRHFSIFPPHGLAACLFVTTYFLFKSFSPMTHTSRKCKRGTSICAVSWCVSHPIPIVSDQNITTVSKHPHACSWWVALLTSKSVYPSSFSWSRLFPAHSFLPWIRLCSFLS